MILLVLLSYLAMQEARLGQEGKLGAAFTRMGAAAGMRASSALIASMHTSPGSGLQPQLAAQSLPEMAAGSA